MSAGWIKVYGPGEWRGRDGWHVRGKDAFGRPIQGRLPAKITTAGAAGRLAGRLLKESNRRPPEPVEPKPDPGPDRSFKAAAKAYKISRRPSATEWERIEKLIACKEIGPVHVKDLGTEQAATFATTTRPTNAPDTLNREVITPYSSVIHFACDEGWRPYIRIRRFKEAEDENVAVTPAEVDKLVANADATGTYEKGARNRIDRNAAYKTALLEFLRLRGTRITDTLGIHRERDLDLQSAKVRLTIGKRRDKVVWLNLTPKVVALFANLKPCEGGYLFPWRSRSSVYKWWGPLRKRLNLKVTPHQFRHALGEEAIDAGIDLLTLKGMMGAASLNSVRRYARISAKRLAEADRLRAEEAARGPEPQTATEIETPAADNVTPLERKQA